MSPLAERKTKTPIQGWKKVLAGRLGQEDFPAEQEKFHSHLPTAQGIRQAVCQLNH